MTSTGHGKCSRIRSAQDYSLFVTFEPPSRTHLHSPFSRLACEPFSPPTPPPPKAPPRITQQNRHFQSPRIACTEPVEVPSVGPHPQITTLSQQRDKCPAQPRAELPARPLIFQPGTQASASPPHTPNTARSSPASHTHKQHTTPSAVAHPSRVSTTVAHYVEPLCGSGTLWHELGVSFSISTRLERGR